MRGGADAVTLGGIEARLKSRRGVLALWLAATAGAALVAVLMAAGGVPGWDDAAHIYKVFLLRNGQSVFWDDFWYGGGYGAIDYGFVFYWLAQYVPAKVIVVIAAGALAPLYYIYQRSMWHIDDVWPAWAFAGIMSVYLAHGQDPFVFALALTMGGLAALARGRPLLAAVPAAVAVFANPMAFVVCAPLMVADVLGRPQCRRRYLWFFAALAPFVLVRLLMGWAFSEPGDYLNETSQLMLYLGFALAGLALAGVNAAHPRRPFVILFLTYSAICVLSFVTPGSPLGNNIGRFFFVFGLPLLLLLRHTRLQRPFPYGDLAVIPIVLFAVLQVSAPYSHFTRGDEWPQTRASFFAPALRAAAEYHDPDYRLHVVALRRHWEALYFPVAGYPITRGWYRQADAIHNGLFYTHYDAAVYEAWLRRMGVRYIFLADAPLDAWSQREVRILKTSPAFEVVQHAGVWTIYRFRDAEPLLVGLDGGSGTVDRVGHRFIDVTVTAAGDYALKFSWSPYWVLEGGEGTLSRSPDGFIRLHANAAGPYTVRFDVTPARVLETSLGRLGL
jgi:hypothetical protein